MYMYPPLRCHVGAKTFDSSVSRFSAHDKEAKLNVALKVARYHTDVPPTYVLRELGLLKAIDHESVVRLQSIEWEPSKKSIICVLLPAKADLKRWLDARFPGSSVIPM